MTGIRGDREFDAKIAGQDLSGEVYSLASLTDGGELTLCGHGEAAWGAIVRGGPAGRAVEVQTRDIARVRTGGAIRAGARVMSDASGKAIEAAGAGSNTFGIAIQPSWRAGELIDVAVDRGVI